MSSATQMEHPFDLLDVEPPYDSFALQRISKAQFGTQAVPEDYLTQLRHHLDFFPHDYLFKVIPHEGDGFGLVKCLEPGCNSNPIVLGKRNSRIDGGRSVGVGGLAKYQSHILDDEHHETLRDGRVVRQEKNKLALVEQSTSQKPLTPTQLLEPPQLDWITGSTQADQSKPQTPRTVITRDDSKPLTLHTVMTPSPFKRPLQSSAIEISPKQQKKPRLGTVNFSGPSKDIYKSIAVDSESSDGELSGTLPLRQANPMPNVIDLEDSDGDADVKIIKPTSLTESERTNDVNTFGFEEDEDFIWMDGQGLVSLKEFGNRHKGKKPPANSRPASSITKEEASKWPVASKHSSPYLPAKNSIVGSTSCKPLPSFNSGFPLPSMLPSFPHSPSSSSSLLPSMKPNSIFSLPNHSGSEAPAGFPSSSQKMLLPWYVRDSDSDSDSDSSDESVDFLDWSRHWSSSSHTLARRTREYMPPSTHNEPQLEPQEIQEFYKRAIDNMDFANSATVTEARKSLEIPEGEDARMDGLSVKLMAHQLIGVSWMITQEKSNHMGGILGDEMGLGKTIQMIATMVKHRSTNPKVKATLVLAPLALLQQWKEEIEDRTTCDLKVIIWHSAFMKPNQKKLVFSADVVITTLDTLCRDWDPPQEGREQKHRDLFKVDWYRVVIDEAQIIRNHRIKRSNAVCSLKSVFRWCLSGTPIFNSLMDIFPYIRFLRIRPYNEVKEFRQHITTWEKKRPNLATQRAQAVLATCMLRRTKDTKLDGKTLIVLPKKSVEDVMIDMSPAEREVYDMVEKSAQRKFNVYLRRGTVLKNIASVLVLLLRLRQACGHPDLVTEEDKTSPESHNDISFSDPQSELKRAIENLGKDWVENVKEKFCTEFEELIKAEKLKTTEAVAPECPICSDPLDDTSRITKCKHVFCEGCIDTLLAHFDAAMDSDRIVDPDKVSKPCPNCRAPFRRVDTYLKAAFVPPPDDPDDDNGTLPDAACVVRHKMKNGLIDDSDDDEVRSPVEKDKGKGKEKEPDKAEDAVKEKEKLEGKRWNYQSEYPPSAKIAWLLEEISRVSKEDATDKIIVVSQFTSMLRICSTFLYERELKFVFYQGSMSTEERSQAVATFKGNDDYRLMLMSLKCGGVGLNLTRANRVISLDLAWSPAAEKQAFDRVHRLGQNKDVFVKRVMINNSVEQRICNLQRRKQDITDNALGEGTGQKLKRMTVGELANLFNLNTNGETLS